MTQKQIVLNKLKEVGDKGLESFWGYENYIPRLADVIYRLKQDGYLIDRIEGCGSPRTNGKGKNGCLYYLRNSEPITQEKFWNDLVGGAVEVCTDNHDGLKPYYFDNDGKKVYLK